MFILCTHPHAAALVFFYPPFLSHLLVCRVCFSCRGVSQAYPEATTEVCTLLEALQGDLERLTAADGPSASEEPASKRPKLQATMPDENQLVLDVSAVNVKSGGGTGKAKHVKLYEDQLYVEGLRNGDFSVPMDDIVLVVSAPKSVTVARQKLDFLAMLLSQPLGKSDVVVFSFKPNERAVVLPGPRSADMDMDLGAQTGQLLSQALPVLADCRSIVVNDPIPCHLKVDEGFLYLHAQGVFFLPKPCFCRTNDIASIEISGRAFHTFDLLLTTHSGKNIEFTMIPRDFEHRWCSFLSFFYCFSSFLFGFLFLSLFLFMYFASFMFGCDYG